MKALLKASKKGVAVSDFIDNLVEASRQVAQNAIDEAKQFAGAPDVDKELAKAAKNMAGTQKKLDKGKPDKATSKFKSAWKHAQQVLDKAGNSLENNFSYFYISMIG
ncbi:MAG: hypothetical protein ACE5IR_07030 [bacterium]